MRALVERLDSTLDKEQLWMPLSSIAHQMGALLPHVSTVQAIIGTCP